MGRSVKQGDIIELKDGKARALILSKDFFNETGLSVVCPVMEKAEPDALHVLVGTNQFMGVVMCEQLKTLDLNKRYFRVVDRLSYSEIQQISDIVQSIFDYYPYSL